MANNTPNLLVSHIATNQNQKEVTANAAFDELDGALTALLSKVLPSDADYTLTATEAGEAFGYLAYVFTGTISTTRNIIVPTSKTKLYVVKNSTTGGHSIVVKTLAGTGITVGNGTGYAVLYCDGTNVVQLTAAGGLGSVTGSGAVVLATAPTLLAKNLNGIRFADEFGSLAAAYADLPSDGGVVYVPSGYIETMTASLTMDKPNSGFIFLGRADITMGVYQIIVPAGTHGIFFYGQVPFGGGDITQGARFLYSGSAHAIDVGNSTVTTRMFGWKNVAVHLTGGAIGAAVGLYLSTVVFFDIHNFSSVNTSASTTTIGLVCDGGSVNFCGNGRIGNPEIINHKTGMLATGSGGANGMNAVEFSGSQRINSSVAGAIGFDFEVAQDNVILSMDFESNAIALKLGAGAIDNTGLFRSEANTVDIQAIAGSSANRFQIQTISGTTAVVVSDAGTHNHFSRMIDGDFEVVNAVNGYKVNGVALSAADLSDGTTGSGTVVRNIAPTLGGNVTLGFDVDTAPMASVKKFSLARTADIDGGWILDNQDELFFADLVRSAVTTVTPATDGGSGSYPNLYKNDSSSISWVAGAIWPIVIITDVSSSIIGNAGNGYFSIGLTFRSDGSLNVSPTNIKIEFWDVTGGVWNTVFNAAVPVIDASGQWISPKMAAPSDDGFTISKVRVTLNGTNSTASTVRIQRLILYHATSEFNPWNLAVNGGTIWGSLALTGTVKAGSFTVVGLPGGSEGQCAYATNGRKVGEGPGAGTGVPVYFSNGNWRVFSTDLPVAS